MIFERVDRTQPLSKLTHFQFDKFEDQVIIYFIVYENENLLLITSSLELIIR